MNIYTPIQSERLYEQIVNQIESLIISGALKVGDQLPPERDLAEQFSVSRTAVREAIKALREKGLVEIHLGRGTFVTSSTSGAVRRTFDLFIKADPINGSINLTEVREIMEPEIAGLAARRITQEQINSMQEAIEIMNAAVAADDSNAFIEADLDFHIVLAEASQNPIVLVLMDSIIDLLREQRKRIGNVSGGLARGQYHHQLILEAIIRHDEKEARNQMRKHLRQVSEDSN